MSCAPINHCPPINHCEPRAFTLFQTCDPGCDPVYATNDWEICKDGDKTRVKLDCGYTLEFNEKHSEIYIIKPCGEKTRIWGDPHVDFGADGKNDFDFWGTTTFQLKDGTKITINTEPWKNNASMYLANNVVVTKGDKSLIVDGLSQNTIGDFKIQKGVNGRELDKAVNDGKLTVYENPHGPGWVDKNGGVVNQEDGNQTKITASDPKPLSYAEQQAILAQCPKPIDCTPKYCFTWLEALAAAFGTVLTKQVQKMDWIYKNLQACYAISPGKECTKQQYEAYCAAMKDMGVDTSKFKSYEQLGKNAEGKTVLGDDHKESVANGQVFWQQLLTGASQQFQLSAQTGMTVQNAVSQGLQTIARAN
ncbi:MAG: hypothetical protein RJA99_3835 [Pseudomonadota bacterium]|jgi:hypothetical protein